MSKKKIRKVRKIKSKFLLINLVLVFLVVVFAVLHFFVVFKTQKIQVLGSSIEKRKLIPEWQRVINFSFSNSVDKEIVEKTFKIEPSVLGVMTWRDDKNLSIQLDQALNPDTKYQIQFSYASSPLPFFPTTTPEVYNLQFETGEAPRIISSIPENDQVNVSMKKDIIFNFNQKVNSDEFKKFFLIKPKISGTFLSTGNSVVFTPDEKLPKNANYFVAVLKGMPGILGEQMIEDYVLNFQTSGNDINKPILNARSVHVSILMYHNVGSWGFFDSNLTKRFKIEPKMLDAHLKYISENYKTVSMQDVYNALENDIPLPENAVVLTFDDGWKGLYVEAFPILKKYHLYFTAYLISSYIDNNFAYLKKTQVHEMLDSGLMELGNHTVDHALLGFYGKSKIEFEIENAESQLFDDFGVHAKTFAYPGGSYNSAVLDELEKEGFKSAVTVKPGSSQKESELFLLKRVEIDGTDNLVDLQKKIEM